MLRYFLFKLHPCTVSFLDTNIISSQSLNISSNLYQNKKSRIKTPVKVSGICSEGIRSLANGVWIAFSGTGISITRIQNRLQESGVQLKEPEVNDSIEEIQNLVEKVRISVKGFGRPRMLKSQSRGNSKFAAFICGSERYSPARFI